MSKEDRQQHEIVVWFSQTYPEYYGHLFSVNNTSFSDKDWAHKKAMGQIAGVSDLVLIAPSVGTFCGIEVKAQSTRHDSDHIRQQLKWGVEVVKSGGMYLMTSNIALTKEFITAVIKGDRAVYSSIQFKCYQSIKEKLDAMTKTISF